MLLVPEHLLAWQEQHEDRIIQDMDLVDLHLCRHLLPHQGGQARAPAFLASPWERV